MLRSLSEAGCVFPFTYEHLSQTSNTTGTLNGPTVDGDLLQRTRPATNGSSFFRLRVA